MRIAARHAMREDHVRFCPGGTGGEQKPARRRSRKNAAPRQRHQKRAPSETPQVRGVPLNACVADPPVV